MVAVENMGMLLGLSLATTGLCYLALWVLGLVTPPPRFGAILLLISAIGAMASRLWVGSAATAVYMTLVVITVPLLFLVCVVMWLGKGAPD